MRADVGTMFVLVVGAVVVLLGGTAVDGPAAPRDMRTGGLLAGGLRLRAAVSEKFARRLLLSFWYRCGGRRSRDGYLELIVFVLFCRG